MLRSYSNSFIVITRLPNPGSRSNRTQRFEAIALDATGYGIAYLYKRWSGHSNTVNSSINPWQWCKITMFAFRLTPIEESGALRITWNYLLTVNRRRTRLQTVIFIPYFTTALVMSFSNFTHFRILLEWLRLHFVLGFTPVPIDDAGCRV